MVNFFITTLYFTNIHFSSHDHLEILVNTAGELLFFRQREGPWMPTLKLFHKCIKIIFFLLFLIEICFIDPFFVTMQQVDKGAIRFVLSGANIMCPGLTSPGAKMTEAPKGTVVVSFCNIPFYKKHYVSPYQQIFLQNVVCC